MQTTEKLGQDKIMATRVQGIEGLGLQGPGKIEISTQDGIEWLRIL